MNFNYVKIYQNDVNYLKFSGILVNNNNNDVKIFKYYFYFVNIFFFGLINVLLEANLILTMDGLIIFCKIGYMAVFIGGLQIRSILIYLNRDKLGNLITDLNNEMYQPKDEAEMVILKRVYNRYEKIRNAFLGLAWGAGLSMAPLPFFTGEKYMPCWYPLNIESYQAVKIIVYIHQYISMSHYLIIQFFAELILGGLLTFVGLQCELLSHRVEALGQLGPVNRDDWIECIRHKELISRFVDAINEVFGMMYFVHIFASTITLCMFMFLLSETKLSYEFYFLAAIFVVVFGILLLPCSFATYMTTKSENIPNAAYNCNWPDATNSFKKELSFFIACTQRPMKFYAGGYFEISMVMFATILRSALSYFAVMQNVSND